MKNVGKQAGQSILEVVFVISIMALLLSGLAAGTTFVLMASRFAREQTTASQIAKAQIEQLRGEKLNDQWWQSLHSYCYGRNHCQTSNVRQNNYNFQVKTCYSQCQLNDSQKSVTVQVTVSWGRRGQLRLTTVLSNWQ